MNSSHPQRNHQDAAGVKVLLVDKDANALTYMSSILDQHSYGVTATSSILLALSMILEKQMKFDLIMSEVDMPGMDGFELLQQITSKVDIPTILISTSEDVKFPRKAFKEGACFVYCKPIATHDLVNIWHHCPRYNSGKNKPEKPLIPREVDTSLFGLHANGESPLLGERPLPSNTLEMGNSIGENNLTASLAPGCENQNAKKPPRLCWTPRLKHKFAEAYYVLGEYRSTPSRMKNLMGEPGLTSKHISSYLQKYRVRMKTQKEEEERRVMPTHMNHPGFRPQRYVHIVPQASTMSGITSEQAPVNLVPKPQMLLNDGLGMLGDNFGSSGGNEVYQNGGLGMNGNKLMPPKMFPKENENFRHFCMSPAESVSACSVNQPSPPHVQTITEDEDEEIVESARED